MEQWIARIRSQEIKDFFLISCPKGNHHEEQERWPRNDAKQV
jgi:hypothetical protein